MTKTPPGIFSESHGDQGLFLSPAGVVHNSCALVNSKRTINDNKTSLKESIQRKSFGIIVVLLALTSVIMWAITPS